MFNGPLEVGKEYELNNGELLECEHGNITGFKFGKMWYVEDGRCPSFDYDHPLSVRGPAVGTLEELDVKPGDVVEYDDKYTYTIEGSGYASLDGNESYFFPLSDAAIFRIISRAEHAKPDGIRQFNQWERVEGEGSGLYAFGEYRISRKTAGRYSAYVVTPLGRENTILAENANKSDAHRLCVRHSLGVDESPTLFRDMTDAEVGSLYRAIRNGKVIQMYTVDARWVDCVEFSPFDAVAYRIKPEPTTETRTLYMGADLKNALKYGSEDDAYKLHFDVIDGRPCNPRFEAIE